MELSKDEIKWLRKLNSGISMHYFQNRQWNDKYKLYNNGVRPPYFV
jgi:hypothetical protein